MRAKHSQMWRRGFRGWQRLGAVGCRGQGGPATEPEGGGALGLGRPEPGQRSSRTRSERAAAGRAGPAAEVKGRGLPGCLWGGEPAGSGASLRLKAAGRRSRGRSTRPGRPLESRAWAPASESLRHTDRGDPQRGVPSMQDSCTWDQQSFFSALNCRVWVRRKSWRP